MDAASDIFWPALLFTLLAVILAAVVTGRNKAAGHQARSAVEEERAGPDPPASSQSQDKPSHENRQQDIQLEASAKKAETIKHVKDSDDVCRSDFPVEEESGIRNALRDYAESHDAEQKPLRYMACMLRTCELEKMMTREELEEEQRVQREQLAAIFQLLKDKQETFGEVTESDLQEQLKLYSV